MQGYNGHIKQMQIFYVGVFLASRVHFKPYGFTSYVDCFVESNDQTEAGRLAKEHFEAKFKVSVTGTRPKATRYINREKFASDDQIISSVPLHKPLEQSTLFDSI